MQSQTSDLWKGSHWLSRSPEVLASRLDEQKWRKAKQTRGDDHPLKIAADAVATASTSGKNPNEIILAIMDELNAKESPKSKLIDSAKELLLNSLHSGTYRGYGFDRPRTTETEPVLVPAECWRGLVSWHKCKVTFQSLAFTEVRIRMIRERNDPLLKEIYKSVAPKLGRPSVGDDIKLAFYALQKIEEINTDASLTSHYPKIRAWLELNKPNIVIPPVSISDKTMYAHLSKLFK